MADNFYASYPVSSGGGGGGVTSLNTLTGAVTLAAGANITLTPVGNTITIAATGSSGANTALSNLTATAINADLTPDTGDSYLLGGDGAAWLAVFAGQISHSVSGPTIQMDDSTMNLLDSSSNVAISVQARALVDTASATQLSWTTAGVFLAQAAFTSSTTLIPSVAANIPSLILDGTTSAATTAGFASLLLKSGVTPVTLGILTQDQSSTTNSAQILIETGTVQDGSSGSQLIQTGDVEGAGGGPSGGITISTGGLSDGSNDNNTGDITLVTGQQEGLGARGQIVFIDGSESFAGRVWTNPNGDGRGTWAAPTVAVTTMGTFGSTPNNNGGSISGATLTLQPADATHPGGLSTTTQSIAGNKTFTGTIAASNLSGTNTGDVTLAAVGSSPSANGASLSGQVLTLQPFDSTHPGVVTASGGGTANFLRADGSWAAPPNITTNQKLAAITFSFDGSGSPITTGIKGDISIPYDATIQSVVMLADTTGSIVVDIWKDTYANYPPTGADSITASAKPTISSSNKSTDTTLTGWTTTITAGDTLRFNVDSASAITRMTLVLKVSKT